ncbi:GNAT family N-acetyltransferase [Streptomyces bambusae]|uniref:GNAT family N-acetyltransferase n=1 Tax=Streptomyces bambusae TaxID=1550616 RepID=UPI001CFFF5FC|nr:GNAT family N-acetyltransferase [Streptomyces bambusae]MCB5170384.1 GNAT family N-acetyltransferase [Streptomyces bambusae]
MQILSFPESATPDALRGQVLALQDEAWPSADGVPAAGPSHDPLLRPQSMLLVAEDGTVLAALDLLYKDLAHAGRSWRAAGLSTVVTRSAARGRGHGRRLVGAARAALAADPAVDLGLFTCDRALRPFYEAAGWTYLPESVLVGGTPDDPFPSDAPGFDKTVMAAFFTAPAREARPVFTGSRIPLHPGRIDRLW